MSAADVIHAESWTLAISRVEGDGWPDRPVEHSAVAGKMYRPEKITARLDRGHARATVTIRGWVVKRDGTPGQVPAGEQFYTRHGEAPAWVAAEIRAVRDAHGLTPETTGVGWEL